MRSFLLICLMTLALGTLTGCGWSYNAEEKNADLGVHYGDTPQYFNSPQPGWGSHNE